MSLLHIELSPNFCYPLEVKTATGLTRRAIPAVGSLGKNTKQIAV
jgi:hypothetical protein